ncbi:MAG: radical SAM family heme chaperone HemW [Burkholderiales bacterium]|jgi:oxygen-independent coproporphyrinogen-3 oxidase
MPPNFSPILGFGVRDQTTLLAALPPLSLYIHIPWCIKKCPYCDFNSHEVKPVPHKQTIPIASGATAGFDEQRYIDALIADLDATLPKVWGRRIHTIFFGGGTPSVFSAAGIDAILAAVRARLPLNADAEITLEANPGTFEAKKFKGYRDAGVNRLSIGIQSFNAKHLRALGRVHDATEARRAVGIAQACFDNINLDLMYALPQQTLDECAADIDTALSFGTNHLSIYHLTLEPNTLFHAKPPLLPDDELAADMQDMIAQKLSQAGYAHYETSAYAKPGKLSQHNLNYWQFGDYIGIGAGAHGKISFPDKITREMRFKQPKAFMDAALGVDPTKLNAIQESTTVAARDLPFEFMMNALRLNDGFPAALFTERTGLPINVIARELQQAEDMGLLLRDHQHIAPSEKGRLFLNELLQIFLAH